MLAAFAERFSLAPDPSSYTPSRIKTELLSGLTVALALVPEAVAFAFVAGVHPLVGLYAALIVGLVTALYWRAPRHDLWCYWRLGCGDGRLGCNPRGGVSLRHRGADGHSADIGRGVSSG